MKNETSVKCENITKEIVQKYQRNGFELVFQEYVMEKNLRVIPCIESSSSLQLESWSTSTKENFYEVYYASFRDRPGFPGWSMEKWVDWISSSPTFLPERSYIARVDNQVIGFIASDKDSDHPDKKGYIIQVGVIPEWRCKGIAATLTCKCLEAFCNDGKESVILHVNRNNPDAISLYERLGFTVVRRRGTFEKLSN